MTILSHEIVETSDGPVEIDVERDADGRLINATGLTWEILLKLL